MAEIPSDPVAAAELAREALEHVTATQAAADVPTGEQFVAYGELLTRTLSELEALAVILAGQAARYGEAFVPGTADAERIQSLQQAVRHLSELAEVLHTSALHANSCWSEFGRLDSGTGPRGTSGEVGE